MVLIDSWETFYEQAEKLYLEAPNHVRAHSRCYPRTRCVKTLGRLSLFLLLRRHDTSPSTGMWTASRSSRLPTTEWCVHMKHGTWHACCQVTLRAHAFGRVSPQCLKFLTDQAQDLKKVEKMNNLFLTYMCGKDPYADPVEGA